MNLAHRAEKRLKESEGDRMTLQAHGNHNHADHVDDAEHGDDAKHGDHTHSISANADRRYLLLALALILGFMLFEVVIGFLASSLALIADAGHMLTDAGALGLALVAIRLAATPATGGRTFGLKRAEILSAQANGLTLLVLAALFIYEAIRRLLAPPVVEGGLVFVIALVGVAVNIAATWALSRANRQSLNIAGSFQHILTDLYAFIATAIAGGLIYLTHFYRFDALASLLVAGLMARAGYKLVKESSRIFLEAAPQGMDPAQIGAALGAEPGVLRVHDLHVWEVTSGFPALSAHVQIEDCYSLSEQNALLTRLTGLLAERYGVTHTTLQLESESGSCETCETPGMYCRLPNATTSGESAHSHDTLAAQKAGVEG